VLKGKTGILLNKIHVKNHCEDTEKKLNERGKCVQPQQALLLVRGGGGGKDAAAVAVSHAPPIQ
jgi:hypothetical protein